MLQNGLNKLSISFLLEGTMCKLLKIGQVVLEKKKIKDNMMLNLYITRGIGERINADPNLNVLLL